MLRLFLTGRNVDNNICARCCGVVGNVYSVTGTTKSADMYDASWVGSHTMVNTSSMEYLLALTTNGCTTYGNMSTA